MEQYHELCTLGDLLVRGAVRCPEREAVVLPGARRTYAELRARATEVARSLASLGVARGDHVGVLMPNCVDFIEVIFGAAFLGATPVAINARSTAQELRYVVQDADLRVLLVGETGSPQTSRVTVIRQAFEDVPDQVSFADGLPQRLRIEDAPALEHVVMVGAAESGGFVDRASFAGLAANVPAAEVDRLRARVSLRDVAMMFYTSGTTANPKGCPLSHEALVRTGVMTADRFGYTAGDRLFDPLPMFHTASTQPMIAIMHVLGTFVTTAHFEAEEALTLIEDERVTAAFTAFPAITLGLLNDPGYRPETFRRVRTLFNVAPPDSLRSMQERMPHTTLVNAYGMTEYGGSVAMVRPDDGLEQRLTQGGPLPGIEIEIRDEANRPLPPGAQGEIVVRGPTMFDGYHNDTEKTAAVIEPTGWFHSGDLGLIDSDGRLHFVGRLKEMLKVGGENVGAVEIESHLQAHKAVNIAQVIGVPDDKYGEVPAAFIEVRPGHTLTEDDVLAHCKGAIASFKVPRYVRFVTEWPMSSTKVQKSKLKALLEEDLGLPGQ